MVSILEPLFKCKSAQLLCQILSPKVGVALEHLQGLVAGDFTPKTGLRCGQTHVNPDTLKNAPLVQAAAANMPSACSLYRPGATGVKRSEYRRNVCRIFSCQNCVLVGRLPPISA